jgi:putative transposase
VAGKKCWSVKPLYPTYRKLKSYLTNWYISRLGGAERNPTKMAHSKFGVFSNMQYRRAYIPGGTFFFTVVTHRRRPIFADPAHVQILRQAFAGVMKTPPFMIDAIVVLPDHIHTIWTLPRGDIDFSVRWKLIKGSFSKMCPKEYTESQDPSRLRKGERAIWQRRFWEHAIRDGNDLERHVEYIHYNPVKHGLVKAPRDYVHSSFHKYVQTGLVEVDWGANLKSHLPSWYIGIGIFEA